MLNKLHIITLQEINGCGLNSIGTILNNISERKDLNINSYIDLFHLVENLSANGMLRYFRKENITLENFAEAESRAKRIIFASEENGIGIITKFDQGYPEVLKTTIDAKGKPSAPVVLYYKGNINILSKPGIAIIGTREPTLEGKKASEFFSRKFAEKGFNIVSGLAIGCDSCAHSGALLAKGSTTAFLAHGLDSIYPEKNKELAEEILLNGGLLLSEYPIGKPVTRYSLVDRDRLQAGLSNATIVVQTGVKGGTMHAANNTLVSKKHLYVVYYKDESIRNHEKTKGNELLKSKGANYIKGDDDLDNIAAIVKEPIKELVENTLF